MSSSYGEKLKQKEKELFSDIRSSFLDYDPASFVETNLSLDGDKFKIVGNGWKFMADIYRYIALQATAGGGKPVVLCKGRQIGATIMAGALDLYFTNCGLFCNPPIRVLHAFPALAHVKRFSQDKLENLIRNANNDIINKNKLRSQNAVDNLTMKQFNSGTLWVESIGRDADRVRGMTVDVVFFDEIQDMIGQAIGNATKILTAAKYGPAGKGVQVFFGTPKERSSYFNSIWEMSDKRYYHLGCENCKKTFPFYQSNNDSWKDIWLHGFVIQCPICGHQQHKVRAIENGKWIASVNSEDCKYVGFHMNQLYLPNFTKENILDLMPENNPTQSERVWKNEVVGEFYSGSGLPLTKADIYDLCRDPDRAMSKSISPKEKATYLGLDWGGKVDNDKIERGQSYSCAVVLSEAPGGVLLVEHAHKMGDRSPAYKRDTINEMYKRFGIRQAVSDYFFGQDIVYDMQTVYRDRFLGAQGSGSLINPYKYREDELIISYNKDLLVEEIFDKFRKGKIRFPWKSYEYLEWLIDHCTSMEVDIRVASGQQVKTYKKGSIPNDGLMALLYAYIAWKFDVTKGFSIKPGMEKKVETLRPALAYAPRLKI